eukprot:PITA_31697
MRSVSYEEVVKEMPSNKYPGPNGFTLEFFKACWSFLGPEIVDLVEDSRQRSQIWPGINATFFTLMPKTKEENTPDEWLRRIYSMISTPLFSILVNGAPFPTFRSSQGLRHGYPISPFRFIIAVEGLSHAIEVEKLQNDLKGIQIIGPNISVTHQQFLDDNLLYGEAMVREALMYDVIIAKFQATSGMLMNNKNSNVYFFNTPQPFKCFWPIF